MENLIGNMEDEVRCDHLVTSKMKKVWNVQLNLAVKLLEVCKKYDLRIVADWGTALGVVRHKGFIPWDDDMDFRMPRKDYEKLLGIASEEFKSPYFFQTCYTDKGFFLNMAKLRCDNTATISERDVYTNSPFHKGIVIDIFVDDYIPESQSEKQDIVRQSVQISNHVRVRNSLSSLLLPINFTHFVKNIFSLRYRAFWSDQKLMRYLDSILTCPEGKDKSQMGSITAMDYYDQRFVINSDFYDEIVWMPFEQTQLPIFANYDEFLTIEYGDYHKMIKNASGHSVVVMDSEKSYEDYWKNVRLSFLGRYKRQCLNIINNLRSRY